jgi:hypothetical protein
MLRDAGDETVPLDLTEFDIGYTSRAGFLSRSWLPKFSMVVLVLDPLPLVASSKCLGVSLNAKECW